jgi:YD repeat-containing protein
VKNITVIIDRVSGSSIPTAKAEIEEVLEIIKPLRERGLRVRVCRSHSTLKEDKAWRAKAATVALFVLAFTVMAIPASAQQRTFYDSSGRVTGRAATSGNTTTFYDSSGRTTGRATTNSSGSTTIYDSSGRTTGRIGR